MLIRIVKMSFEASYIEQFLENFDQHKEKIRNFPGCRNLELYRDTTNPNVFFTYSYWDSSESLEKYRDSALFKGVWAKTKPGFSEKPQAWSLNRIHSLP